MIDIIEQTVNIFTILRKKLKKLESENQELRNNPTVLEKDKRIQQLHQIIKKRNATIEELLETIDNIMSVTEYPEYNKCQIKNCKIIDLVYNKLHYL